MNIVSMIMQMLTPDRITRIASALGIERSAAQNAIGGAVPALLAGLVGLASTPDGARRLHDTLAQQEPGALDSLMAGVGGASQGGLMDAGSKLVTSLLGSGAAGGLASALGSFSGIGEKSATSLLGLLGPVVTDALGDQQRREGLGATGLADLLSSQKDNIAAAMPSNFASMLSGTGLLSSLGGALGGMGSSAANTVSDISAAAAHAGRSAGGSAQTAAYQAQRHVAAASRTNWLPWALGAVAVVVLGWFGLAPRTAPDVAQAPPIIPPAAPPAATGATPVPPSAATGGGADLRARMTPLIDSVKASLQDITDVSSAQAALPRLQEASAQMDGVLATARQMPADSRNAVSSSLSGALPGLNEMFDRVLAIPGVAPVVKPVIDGMRGKLDELSKA